MERGDETRKRPRRREAGRGPDGPARGVCPEGVAAEEKSAVGGRPGDEPPPEGGGTTGPGDVLQGAAQEAPTDRPCSSGCFEDEFAAAEEAVESLERGDLSLEESLRAYEDGLRALKACYGVLQRAQKRIEVLGREIAAVGDDSGPPFWVPATSSRPLGEVVERVDRQGELPREALAPGGTQSLQGGAPERSAGARSPAPSEPSRQGPAELTEE